jgi:hypothetical protein
MSFLPVSSRRYPASPMDHTGHFHTRAVNGRNDARNPHRYKRVNFALA